ncbi:MAG: stalk domain-containing protein [Bacillota bacterium]
MRPAIGRTLFATILLVLLLAVPLSGVAAPGDPVAGDADKLRQVTVLLDGLPVAFPVSPFLEGGVTMVPLRSLAESLGFEIIWVDDQSPIRCVKGGKTIALTLGDTVVSIEDRSSSSSANLPVAAHLQGGTTVVPLRFFSESLGFEVAWDAETYTASVISPKAGMQVWGFYALGNEGYSSWKDLFSEEYPYPILPGPAAPASGMAGAFMGWFAIDTESGAVLTSGHPSGFAKPDGSEAVLMKMHASGSKPVAMFYADNQGGKLSALLDNSLLRERLALNVATTVTVDYKGVAVDFEGLGLDSETREKDAANLSAFFESLKTYLHGREVYAIVPPLNSAYKGYDHVRLGELCDAVVVMAYGYEDRSQPSATAPWDKVDEAVRLELEAVPREKVILGVPAYGTVYASVGVTSALQSKPAARDQVGPDQAERAWSPSSAATTLAWEDGNTSYRAFVEDNDSLRARASLAKRYGLRGIAIWRLGLLLPGWWESLNEVIEPVR